MYGKPDCQCDVFYSDKAECYAPCVDVETSSSFMSEFSNYLGLAMDAVLCLHCMKNYRNIYPSVLVIVMIYLATGVLTTVLKIIEVDSLYDISILILALLVAMLITICRYFYAGWKIGEACCQGGGLLFNLTMIGVGT